MYAPLEVFMEVPEDLVEAAHEELAERAEANLDRCYGYFPALEADWMDHNLPACRAFADALPTIGHGEEQLAFNFLRLSQVEQRASSSFHLDTDAATALTGSVHDLAYRRVFRLLLNLDPDHARTLNYVNVDAFDLPLSERDGYVYCGDEYIPWEKVATVEIPPRQAKVASGLLFCSSHLLHSGQDDEHGHFVAAYGRD